MGKQTRQGCNGSQDNRINMTRELSTHAAPVMGEVEVLPVSGTSCGGVLRNIYISIHRAVKGPRNPDFSTRIHEEICKGFH